MKRFDTMTEALADLKDRGYIHDFKLRADCIECTDLELQLFPDQFSVSEVHRFEGMSNPDDSSVIYVIESKDGLRGTLVDAYGAYADPLTSDMLNRLRMNREEM